MTFDRETYFDAVRSSLFNGSMTQQQVDGQNFILSVLEAYDKPFDLRHAAYALATTKHETASTMWPIEEYGKGAGQPYAPTWYGRGFVQLTWEDNYRRATNELKLQGADDLVAHPDRALDPVIAARVMFVGMTEGWFRSSDGKPETLSRYFNEATDDPYGAREIINGDKTTVPSWSNGVSIGKLIAEYHHKFLAALNVSLIDDSEPEIEAAVVMDITVTDNVHLEIRVNGDVLIRG